MRGQRSTGSRIAGAGTIAALLLVAPVLVATKATAAPIVYGDFSAATVDYLDVTENTNTPGDPDQMFGPPIISGDSMDFDPVDFSASSSGGGPPDITDGQLTFMVMAKDGNVIESIFLTEAGDASLARSLASADDALAEVKAQIFIDILEVDGVGIDPINVQGSMTFTPSDGEYLLSDDGVGDPTFNTAWTGSYFEDFLPILTANSIDGNVTKISVNLDNTLMASSSTDSSAFIAKKDFDGVTITVNPDPNVIPEPATAVLAVLGLAGLAVGRRMAR